MSVPKPPVPLDDICAVIYDNALYTFSEDAFLRLELAPGAKWEKLSPGVPVKGGVCVGSTPADSDQAGLYIVGGVASDDSYRGLQKFTYSTEKWESIDIPSEDLKGRRWHGATYINSSDTIMVYSGTREEVQHPSSETFTISAQAPYGLESFPSGAPLAVSPLLLPWSETDALMVGGDLTNRRAMLFNPEASWRDSGATLADPIPKDASAIKAVVIDGDDGSKSLITFDMTQSPNVVYRIALMDGNGTPMENSPTVVPRNLGRLSARQSDSDSNDETKPLTLDDWPEYDGDLAPEKARANYAAAQGPDGMVVFAGGDNDNVLQMFNARENTWVEPSRAFEDQERLGTLSASSSASSSTTTTLKSTSSATSSSSGSTLTSSSTPESVGGDGDDDGGMDSNTILGIVLGTVLGVMLLLGLILFLIRRKRSKKLGNSGANALSDDEKGGQAARAMPNVAPRGYGHGHYPQNSTDSYSSMAILMGKVNQQNKHLNRKPSTGTHRSSMSSIFNKEFKSTISKPIPHNDDYASTPYSEKEMEAGDRITVFGPSLSQRVAPPRPPRGSATLDVPPLRPDAAPADPNERRSSGWNRYWSGGSALNILGFGNGKRGTVDSDQSSRYSDNKLNRVTQDSATVPPLRIEPFAGPPELNRVNSGSPTVTQAPVQLPTKASMAGKIERPMSNSSSGYSSGIPESVYDTWDPTDVKKPWGTDRAPTSAYGGNTYGQPSSFDPSSTSGARNIGISQQPKLDKAKASTDMSWLNINANNRG